jgi:hypothetical protein
MFNFSLLVYLYHKSPPLSVSLYHLFLAKIFLVNHISVKLSFRSCGSLFFINFICQLELFIFFI